MTAEKKCTYEYCYAPDSPCNLGEEDFTKCPHWKGASDTSETADNIETRRLLPWSGNSFGIVDLELVSGRSNPTIIGIVGPHDAGKTTLLAAMYLLISHGRMPKGRTLAGSYTLGGWENLANFLRWKGGQAPSFPPHTSSNSGRMPGLLHIALRNVDDSLEDVLLTDAPGEWFERWAVNKNAAGLEGARWISRFASAFMLFADSDALSGPQKGERRTQLIALAERLGDEAGARPVAVIWSKSDVEVSEGIRSALQKKFSKVFRNYHEFSVSVHAVDGGSVTQDTFIYLLAWLLSKKAGIGGPIPSLPVINSQDPFLAFRGQ